LSGAAICDRANGAPQKNVVDTTTAILQSHFAEKIFGAEILL
jgi:hypothetical protein